MDTGGPERAGREQILDRPYEFRSFVVRSFGTRYGKPKHRRPKSQEAETIRPIN